MIKYEKYSPFIIAEIGCNHQGSLSKAKEMISRIGETGCHSVKLQKRHNRSLLPASAYRTPHPNPENSFGETYGAHREFLEFSVEQHAELKGYTEREGMVYSASAWDLVSARQLVDLDVQYIKVPSACNSDLGLMKFLAESYRGLTVVSVGMTTSAELQALLALFRESGSSQRLVILACTSGYPVDTADLCLLEISRLEREYGHLCSGIGFSGHHLGCDMDLVALGLGAVMIERHVTFDKSAKGTDHSASLSFKELSSLVDSVNRASTACTFKSSEIIQIEIPQRKKLKTFEAF